MIPKVVRVVEEKRPAGDVALDAARRLPRLRHRGREARGRGGPALPERVLSGAGGGAAQALRAPPGHGHRGPGRRGGAAAGGEGPGEGLRRPLPPDPRGRRRPRALRGEVGPEPPGADRAQQGRGSCGGCSSAWASASWASARPSSWPGTSAAWRRSAKATVEEIDALYEIGPAVAQSVHDWFARRGQPHASWSVSRRPGCARARKARAPASLDFQGMQFVLTGGLDLDDPRRGEGRDRGAGRARDLVGVEEDVGGRGRGRTPGSKLEKARELGVACIDEASSARSWAFPEGGSAAGRPLYSLDDEPRGRRPRPWSSPCPSARSWASWPGRRTGRRTAGAAGGLARAFRGPSFADIVERVNPAVVHIAVLDGPGANPHEDDRGRARPRGPGAGRGLGLPGGPRGLHPHQPSPGLRARPHPRAAGRQARAARALRGLRPEHRPRPAQGRGPGPARGAPRRLRRACAWATGCAPSATRSTSSTR